MSHNPLYDAEYSKRPEVIARRKQYYIDHKEEMTKRNKIYREKHKDILKMKNKQYRLKNAEKIKKRKWEYYRKNKDTINLARREKSREYMRKKRQTPEWKAYQKEYNKNYDFISYYNMNKERVTNIIKKYNQTEKGKVRARRARDKRRFLGYNKLYENIFDEEVDWHHINNNDIIAIPRDLHQLYLNKNVSIHRENMKSILIQFYPFL